MSDQSTTLSTIGNDGMYNEHMIRGTMALYTILCLFATLLGDSPGPQLVCRITGAPMAPVHSKRGRHLPCCDVSESAVDGATRYALTDPGCCVLRQGTLRSPLTAVKVTAPDMPTARCAAPLPLPSFYVVVDAPLCPEWSRGLSIRPPPQASSASPRGPPTFS